MVEVSVPVGITLTMTARETLRLCPRLLYFPRVPGENVAAPRAAERSALEGNEPAGVFLRVRLLVLKSVVLSR